MSERGFARRVISRPGRLENIMTTGSASGSVITKFCRGLKWKRDAVVGMNIPPLRMLVCRPRAAAMIFRAGSQYYLGLTLNHDDIQLQCISQGCISPLRRGRQLVSTAGRVAQKESDLGRGPAVCSSRSLRQAPPRRLCVIPALWVSTGRPVGDGHWSASSITTSEGSMIQASPTGPLPWLQPRHANLATASQRYSYA
jgi:hypothetical protein